MKPVVLIVDDESNVRYALLRLLRKESYEVISASSAEDAKDFVQRHTIDLIVTDNQMFGVSGVDFLRWVRRFNLNIVRIMLTGKPDADEAARALQDETIHHLFAKPCDVIELAAIIRKELELRVQTHADVPACTNL